ncbi:MAG: NAD-dependent epimerase/dehydratase family protein [Gemmatimonadota bacterium]|nr:NAD-dependent epimerase/dehydratase family protein [Gemmatimonadota bacterium]
MTPTPSIQGRRILITGGAGFIGAALAERLVEHNQVRLFDLGFDGSSVSLSRAWGHPNLEVVEGNVMDADALVRATEGATLVVHLAAVVGVKNVLSRGRDTIEINFTGTSNLLRALEGRRDLDRVVYFSTSEVFGMSAFRAGEDTPSTIGPVSEARWTYSIAKLAGEHLVHTYHRELGMPTAIVRPFNVFGRLRLGDHAMLRFILAALRGEDLEVHGDGTQIRSWCYIDDFVDGLIRVMHMPEAVGETFNLGNPRNTLTIYDLAQRVVRLLDSPSRVRFIEIDFSDIDVRVPRLRNATTLLGYRPRVELDDAVRLTADWVREHRDVLDPTLEGAEVAKT